MGKPKRITYTDDAKSKVTLLIFEQQFLMYLYFVKNKSILLQLKISYQLQTERLGDLREAVL